MKFDSVVVAVALSTSLATALPSLSAPKGHEFIAPGPNDSRGPCPGLNALANHGFLPRSGKNITLNDFIAACKAGLNVDKTFSVPIGMTGLQSNCSSATQMSLEQLGRHDVLIEHDGSLSRQDSFFGPDYPVNARSFNMFVKAFNGANATTLTSAAAAKYTRVQDSIKNNPKVQYGPREVVFSYGETALYLQAMGRSLTSGVAPLEYVKIFLGQDRLPYEQGWTPGPDISLVSVGAMAAALQPLGPAPGDELIYILGPGTYADVLEGKLILGSLLHPKRCS